MICPYFITQQDVRNCSIRIHWHGCRYLRKYRHKMRPELLKVRKSSMAFLKSLHVNTRTYCIQVCFSFYSTVSTLSHFTFLAIIATGMVLAIVRNWSCV